MKIVSPTCSYGLFKESYEDNLSRVEGLVDLILMSPPYMDARTYDNEVSWAFDDYQRLGDYSYRACKPGGQVLMVLDAPVRKWRKGKGTERGFVPWKVMIDWAERIGFRVPDRMAYCRMGAPGKYGSRWRNDWEPLLWFEKVGGKPYFNKEVLATPSIYHRIGKNVAVRKPDGTFFNRPASGFNTENGLKHRGNLWNYGTVGHGHNGDPFQTEAKHPASFSFRLAEDAVRCFSPPGGLVVDPFLGGGSSLVAAIKNDRKFIGGDLFDRSDGVPWIQVAHERLGKWNLA